MSVPIVSLDIAGPDEEALRAFYSGLCGWDLQAPVSQVSVHTPLSVAIRQDPAEKRVYLGVDDVAQMLERVESLGGSVDQPRFEVPGAVILGLFRDPAGNAMGFIELKNGVLKVP